MNSDKDQKICITEESVRAFSKKIKDVSYFIRHVFCFLREHSELLEQPDYRRLYEETLDFQIRQIIQSGGCKEGEVKRGLIELMADLSNMLGEDFFQKFPKKLIDQFLAYRRSIWYGDSLSGGSGAIYMIYMFFSQ